MHQITIQLEAGPSEEQAGFLHEALGEVLPGVLSVSFFAEAPHTKLMILFENPLPLEKIFEALSQIIPDFETQKISYEQEEISPDQDWLDICFRQSPPFQAGHFWVHGSHITAAPENKTLIPLCVDAVQAFGSGSHGTTKGCLELLSAVKEIGAFPRAVLDVGTGSGILAIAAKKLFSKAKILASDNDLHCIQATLVHGKNNDVVLDDVILAEGFGNSAIQKNGPYDLIIANILPGVLIGFEQDLYARLAPDAYVVLSGIPAARAQDVINVYDAQRYQNIAQQHHEDWVSLLLQKI